MLKASKYCYCQCMLLCQQILLCQCSWPVVRQKCTYGNIVVSELLCVRVATLIGNKYASIPRVLSYDNTCWHNCQDFYSIVLDICLALTTAQAKKIFFLMDTPLAKTLVRASWRANPILVCDMICRCLLYDCGMWCGRELYVLGDLHLVIWFIDIFFTIVGCDAAEN